TSSVSRRAINLATWKMLARSCASSSCARSNAQSRAARPALHWPRASGASRKSANAPSANRADGGPPTTDWRLFRRQSLAQFHEGLFYGAPQHHQVHRFEEERDPGVPGHLRPPRMPRDKEHREARLPSPRTVNHIFSINPRQRKIRDKKVYGVVRERR